LSGLKNVKDDVEEIRQLLPSNPRDYDAEYFSQFTTEEICRISEILGSHMNIKDETEFYLSFTDSEPEELISTSRARWYLEKTKNERRYFESLRAMNRFLILCS
jgi:hypothetical protein